MTRAPPGAYSLATDGLTCPEDSANTLFADHLELFIVPGTPALPFNFASPAAQEGLDDTIRGIDGSLLSQASVNALWTVDTSSGIADAAGGLFPNLTHTSDNNGG